MNKRINELAAQAGLQPFEDCGPGYVYKMEKFAELIVRECIDTVLDSSVEYATRPQIANEIREHFGVEK